MVALFGEVRPPGAERTEAEMIAAGHPGCPQCGATLLCPPCRVFEGVSNFRRQLASRFEAGERRRRAAARSGPAAAFSSLEPGGELPAEVADPLEHPAGRAQQGCATLRAPRVPAVWRN